MTAGSPMNRRRRPRRGAVLVVAVVCLMVALSIAATSVTESVSRRLQLRTERIARQAELLVEAGRGRAAARLASNADYGGERWSPTVGGAPLTALVEISSEPTADGAARVTVVVTLSQEGSVTVCRSQVFTFRSHHPADEE